MRRVPSQPTEANRPWGLGWRSSTWFATLVVGFGVCTDLIVYSIVIPVFPFRLEQLGYTGVSALVGYILFAYSGGLVISTLPIAMFCERYDTRQTPFVLGMLFLVGSQILLMEAPAYWVMCLARIIQGVSSSVVWVVGLALLCENVPEAHVGRQLGLAMSGLSIGVLVGPPVGGGLYHAFGYRGPFIFGLMISVIDLLGRLLIIERKDALLWGVDPVALPEKDNEQPKSGSDEQIQEVQDSKKKGEASQDVQTQASPDIEAGPLKTVNAPKEDVTKETQEPITSAESRTTRQKHITLFGVVAQLGTSPRAVTAFFVTIAYGLVYASQEPTIPLHMQAEWGYDSTKVGLVFIASVVPTLFSSPFAGWLADARGAEWVAAPMLILAIPWWLIVIINGPVTLFIFAFAIQSLFTGGALSPITAELAAVARTFDDIGYGHVYGAFNLAYGVGSAVGPLIGGQIYDHTSHGWLAVCVLDAGLVFISAVLAFVYTGETSLLTRTLRLFRRKNDTTNENTPDSP
ncbi:MFS general substrate transporter [Neolentinus lepideus HHB14362 ss-1]|uniref:MFS general substrate transporter n=1 Tax=Neolentinus lepideus HHB14362 ss-1 TaxID=1314782 RepID=A0A165RI04_9AGAM|nr:MFS general substrate transporter [Neolentinus lepideus HHB14362 ss-1]